MKKIAALLLLTSCASAGPTLRFLPEDGYTSRGPAYVCVKEDEGKTMVCLDLREFLLMAREQEAQLHPKPTNQL